MAYFHYKHIEADYAEGIKQYISEMNDEQKQAMFVATEKIDGANFPIVITRDGYNVCSRSKELAPTDDFYEWQSAVNTELVQKLISFVRNNFLGSAEYVVLIGELYGRKINNRINYGDGRYIRFFDINKGGEYISQCVFLASMEEFARENNVEIEDIICPVVKIGTIDQMMSIDVENLHSQVSPTNDIAEGIVIKPLEISYNPDDENGVNVYIKRKAEKFWERSRSKKECPYPKDEVNFEHTDEFLGMINKNRLISVCSKEGEPKTKKDIGKYLSLIVLDACEEFGIYKYEMEVQHMLKKKASVPAKKVLMEMYPSLFR